MTNNLAGLSGKLAMALRDVEHAVWNSTEKDDLITWAVAGLYPRISVPMSKPIYPLVAETEDYALPTDMIEVQRVELGEVATDQFIHVLGPNSWYVYGDALGGTARLFIHRSYADAANYLIVHGYGRYNLTDPLIPDDYVPLVLASARVDALERVRDERSRFLQWQASEQEQDTSINELLGMLQSAQSERERHWARNRTVRRPVPGRMP